MKEYDSTNDVVIVSDLRVSHNCGDYVFLRLRCPPKRKKRHFLRTKELAPRILMETPAPEARWQTICRRGYLDSTVRSKRLDFDRAIAVSCERRYYPLAIKNLTLRGCLLMPKTRTKIITWNKLRDRLVYLNPPLRAHVCVLIKSTLLVFLVGCQKYLQ